MVVNKELIFNKRTILRREKMIRLAQEVQTIELTALLKYITKKVERATEKIIYYRLWAD